ncbi:MAG: hypothetical protein JJU46_05790 [Balneolaceae bacterium]|nr:hypothetical protein [Balneolaceae bacterium]MCH8549191.1 hypothetical protein [Balneolaceae bacterium]
MDNTTSPANNTHLSDKELNGFKKKLEELKKETQKELSTLKERLDEYNKNSTDNQSGQDHHQGDLATSEANKVTVLQSVERLTERKDQINVALDRIATGNYGLCIETGQKIQKGRLEAMPYAIRSVGAKT